MSECTKEDKNVYVSLDGRQRIYLLPDKTQNIKNATKEYQYGNFFQVQFKYIMILYSIILTPILLTLITGL